jgi:hypothetical protein
MRAIDRNDLHGHQGLCAFLPCCAAVVSQGPQLRRHRASVGSPWRKLNPGRQALLVLAYLSKGETFADLAAGFAVGVVTARK